MRICIFVIMFFSSAVANANMASPFQMGNVTGLAIASKQVAIVSEQLVVDIDADFRKALFQATYNIVIDTDNFKLPLLFYARGYGDSMQVFIDGRPTTIKHAYGVDNDNAMQYGGFNVGNKIKVSWDSTRQHEYSLSDLFYFDTKLNKGAHQILVKYLSNVTQDKTDEIKKYYFHYALSPAKHWRSFGKLTYTINYKGDWSTVNSYLGMEPIASTDSSRTWVFDAIPADYFTIGFLPKMNDKTKREIHWIENGRFTTFTVLAILLHLIGFIWYRHKNINDKFNPVLIVGAIVVPLVSCYLISSADGLIDKAIGPHASNFRGYGNFFLWVLSPFYMIGYFFPVWIIDFIYKRVKGKHQVVHYD